MPRDAHDYQKVQSPTAIRLKDQHYFVRKSSETLRKVEMEIVRHQTRGRNATYTVKRIILPLT